MGKRKKIACQLGRALLDRNLVVSMAESCTGGWIAKMLTDAPGSSGWFQCGFVAYSNRAKRNLLGVSEEILTRYGAVSAECVRAMAEGALQASCADLAAAVSGIAGPGGGSLEKPVGTVWFGFAWSGQETTVIRHGFPGDRNAVRRAAMAVALTGLLDRVRRVQA